MAKKLQFILKLAATAAIALAFLIGLGPRRWALVWAQLPTPNPLIAPVPPPAAPSQLPAPITTAVQPSLAPVPTPVPASPTPSVRSFNCSCYGLGSYTNWMGQVAAPSAFAAKQSALKACLTYNETRSPESPFMNPNTFGPSALLGPRPPTLPGSQPFGLSGSMTQMMPGTLNFSTQAQLQNCSNCACD